MAKRFSVDLTTVTDQTCCDGAVKLKAVPGGTVAEGAETQYDWTLKGGGVLLVDPSDRSLAVWKPEDARAGTHRIGVIATHNRDTATSEKEIEILSNQPLEPPPPAPTAVTLRRSESVPTPDLSLWVVIRKATEALSFENYSRFMDIVLCGARSNDRDPLGHNESDYRAEFKALASRRFLPYTDSESYRLLKAATEAFVMVNCGVALNKIPFGQPDLDILTRRVGVSLSRSELTNFWKSYLAHVNGSPDPTLPYLALIRDKLRDSPIVGDIVTGALGEIDGAGRVQGDHCYGIIRSKLMNPCLLELIWSYWQE